MNTSPKPVDWRDSLRGLPIAALTEQGIKPYPKTIEQMLDEIDEDAGQQKRSGATREKISRIFNPPCEAQSAIERLSDRPGPNRWSEQ